MKKSLISRILHKNRYLSLTLFQMTILFISCTEPSITNIYPYELKWNLLSNPILSLEDRMLKDQAVVFHEGYFYIYASARFEESRTNPDRMKTYFYRTKDFLTYDELYDPNIDGIHSPDIVQNGDHWIMVFQKYVQSEFGETRNLLYAVSYDLIHWSEARYLLEDQVIQEDHIDGAIAIEGGYYFIGFKRNQLFSITRSNERDFNQEWMDYTFAYPGEVGDWAENYQFIKINHQWRMIATARNPDGADCEGGYTCDHEPFLYKKAESSEPDTSLASWIHWVDKTHIIVPHEDWNKEMHANSAYLCDWTDYDGYYYLFYAGANDSESFQGRGHGKIGVVRSRDLKNWVLPGH